MGPLRATSGITTKFILYLILVSLVPLLVLGLTSYQVARGTILEQARSHIQLLLDDQIRLLELKLGQVENLIANISGVETITNAIADGLPEDNYGRLATQAQIGYILNGYLNLDGLISIDLFSTSGAHYHVGETLSAERIDEAIRSHLYTHAIAAGRDVHWDGVTPNINQDSPNQQVLPAARALMRTDRATLSTRPIGLLLINLDIQTLGSQFKDIEAEEGTSMILMDGHERIIHYPDDTWIGKSPPEDLLAAIRSSGTAAETIDGAPYIVTCSSVPRVDWRLCHAIPQSVLLERTQLIRNSTAAALFASLSIVAVAAWFYTRDVVQPIRQVIASFRQLGDRNHAPPPRLAVRTKDEIGELSHWFNAFLDTLTSRDRAEAQLRHDATFDSLTGLCNRTWFKTHLQEVIDRGLHNGRLDYALLFLDLDRFKIINDTLGHDTGDALLVRVAERLRAHVRGGDALARLGGDEFVVLLEGSDESRDRQVANRLLEAIGQKFMIGALEVTTNASIGIAHANPGYKLADELLRDADIAMYQAKARGKGCFETFGLAMREQILHRSELEQALTATLANQQLKIMLQPIIGLADCQLVGFEALVRWDHAQYGPISPAEFIPLAEETKQIRPLGHWIFREACRQLHAWQGSQSPGQRISIAVNFSPHQITDQAFIDAIPEILAEFGLSGSQLVVEITETAILRETVTASRVLKYLRGLGIKIHLDDFGTGYSSLSHLSDLPIDAVKIDRSFVSNTESSVRQRGILKGLIMLAHQLDIITIAEGIETYGQWRILMEEGCDLGQGYLISRPMGFEEASTLIISQQSLHPRLTPATHRAELLP